MDLVLKKILGIGMPRQGTHMNQPPVEATPLLDENSQPLMDENNEIITG